MLLQLDSLTWRRLNGVIVLNNKVRCQDFQCGQYNMWISLAASDVWKCTCTWFRWGRELMSDDKRVHWAWMGTDIQGGGAPVSPVQSVQIHTQCSVSQCTEMFIILAKTRTVTLSWIWSTKRHTQLHKNAYAKTHRSFQRLLLYTIVLKKYYTRATLLVLWSCMWLYVVHCIVGLHIDLWPGNTKSTV